ncbi:hypothetical protein Bbelb_406810 [Branchiostoma belcheri]|nr:hypothetical protein Bbelb_406810 [Branchiostoma belcheri]
MAPKRRQWSDEDMASAFHAVKNKELSLGQAAKAYHVPKESLRNRVTGKTKLGSKPGPEGVLRGDEEAGFVTYLTNMAELGFGLTRSFAGVVLVRLLKGLGRDVPFNGLPSSKFWRKFERRHPELTLRKTDPLSLARSKYATPAAVKRFFTLYTEQLEKLGLQDRPDRIFNVDESSMNLDPQNEKVYATKGAKKVSSQSSGYAQHVTLVAGGNAIGGAIPPMIIFEGAQLRQSLLPGPGCGYPGATYSCAKNGYMNGKLFKEYISKNIIPHVPSIGKTPVLVILDQHSSHVFPETLRLCQKNNITLLGLPPHATHIMQPLDAGGVLHSLKANYSKQARAVILAKESHVLQPADLPAIVRGAYLKSVANPDIMGAAFEKCGLWPVSEERALSSQQLRISATHQTSSANSQDESAMNVDQPLMDEPSATDAGGQSSTDESGFSGDSSVDSSWLDSLVRQNLIPSHLAKHLLAPMCTSTPKKKKTMAKTSGAKVFTEEEFIREKEEQQNKREEAELKKEERKKQRETKAEEKAARKREAELKKEQRIKQQENHRKENIQPDCSTARKRRPCKPPAYLKDYE